MSRKKPTVEDENLETAEDKRRMQNRKAQRRFRAKLKLAKSSTDPQSATTTGDGTAEESLQGAGPLDKGAKEALSGDSCSREETGTSEHSSPQLTLAERITRVGQTIQTLQKEVENANPSVGKGLQEPMARIVRGNTVLKNSLRNIEPSPQLLLGDQLPFPDTPTSQQSQQHHTTWIEPYRASNTSGDTSVWTQVVEMRRSTDRRTKTLEIWRAVEMHQNSPF